MQRIYAISVLKGVGMLFTTLRNDRRSVKETQLPITEKYISINKRVAKMIRRDGGIFRGMKASA